MVNHFILAVISGLRMFSNVLFCFIISVANGIYIRSKCAWSCCVCRIYNVLNLTTLTCAYSITASLYVILN